MLGLGGEAEVVECGERGVQAAVGKGPHGVWGLELDGIVQLGRSAHDPPQSLFRPSYTTLNSAVTLYGILSVSSHRKHVFIAAEVFIYFLLAVIDVFTHTLPTIGTSLDSFKALDIIIGECWPHWVS